MVVVTIIVGTNTKGTTQMDLADILERKLTEFTDRLNVGKRGRRNSSLLLRPRRSNH